MRYCFILLGLFLVLPQWSRGENESVPRPIPVNRPEMKKYLEDMKGRKPRIPLPELTDEEKASLDERGRGYESRLRSLYLPGGDDRSRNNASSTNRPAGQGRDNEPGMTLDYRFKVSLFWIVSRTNNCQYCLGHQESKLLRAGMFEDEIASLDSDWSHFTEAEQAAFRFARRFTLEPHLLGDDDIAELRPHYTDPQILEMILSMAGNNSINRWKEGVGVPQSASGGGLGRNAEAAAEPKPESHSYLTPTSEKFAGKVTTVAPLALPISRDKLITPAVFARPPLESREEAEKALATAAKRTPRLPLIDEPQAREALAEAAPEGPLPHWMRLVAHFPQSGKRVVTTVRNAEEKGDLTPLLKAQVSWIIARQDRAWYALGQAKQRLEKLGQSADQIYSLDGDWQSFSPRDQAMFRVAKNLAASPVVLSDAEFAEALDLAGPRDMVQLVSFTTTRASFDRITEAAGLPLEE